MLRPHDRFKETSRGNSFKIYKSSIQDPSRISHAGLADLTTLFQTSILHTSHF